MRLTEHERERLLITLAADVAERRRGRGLKAGVIAWANMGDANASIPTPQPQLPRPMFGAFGAMPAPLGLHFTSPAALEAGLADRWESERRLVPTKDVSCLSKASLPENDALPTIDVDSETFAVRVDGELIEPQPAAELPMAFP